MMMPRCGEIPITYAPDAADGFRLGLMADFGLDMSDAEDVSLDDIICIDADTCGGVIAGSNPGALSYGKLGDADVILCDAEKSFRIICAMQ